MSRLHRQAAAASVRRASSEGHGSRRFSASDSSSSGSSCPCCSSTASSSSSLEVAKQRRRVEPVRLDERPHVFPEGPRGSRDGPSLVEGDDGLGVSSAVELAEERGLFRFCFFVFFEEKKGEKKNDRLCFFLPASSMGKKKNPRRLRGGTECNVVVFFLALSQTISASGRARERTTTTTTKTIRVSRTCAAGSEGTSLYVLNERLALAATTLVLSTRCRRQRRRATNDDGDDGVVVLGVAAAEPTKERSADTNEPCAPSLVLPDASSFRDCCCRRVRSCWRFYFFSKKKRKRKG